MALLFVLVLQLFAPNILNGISPVQFVQLPARRYRLGRRVHGLPAAE